MAKRSSKPHMKSLPGSNSPTHSNLYHLPEKEKTMRFICKSFFSVASVVILALLATVSQASTWSVPGNFPTIQAAISSASVHSGDTINVAVGTYHESLSWQNKSLTIQGAGVGASILDPSSAQGGPGGGCVYAYN